VVGEGEDSGEIIGSGSLNQSAQQVTVSLVHSVKNADSEDRFLIWGDGGQLLVEVHTNSGTECASPLFDLLFFT
jgi:hypothetical protein